ncbi:MAG: Hpt domain-containing protein [Parasporobacterium sp.]|nr:Hpt domain-containing protein [Parasporobacterium sp.]
MADLEKMKALGIDIDEGVACCADDPEFYEEMLGEYVSEAKKGAEELRRAFAEEDWKSYGIRAHTIKSTSRMIGARNLSESALRMETAAKEGNFEEIRLMHASFMEDYEVLTSGIKEGLDG